MEIADYLSALRRHWRTWTGVTVVGVLLALVAAAVLPTAYTASATVFVATTNDSTDGSQFVNQRVKSYPDVAVSRSVLLPVSEDVGLPYEEVRDLVSATNPVDTSQISISVTADDAATSAEIANAVAERFGREVERLETPGEGSSPVNLTVTDPATTPTSPSAPDVTLLLVLGVVAGLFLGLACAVVQHRTDRNVRTEADVRRAWGPGADTLPVLAPVATGWVRTSEDGRPEAVLARRLDLLAEARPAGVLFLSPSPDPRHSPVAVAADVADELAGKGIASRTTDSPDAPRVLAPAGVDHVELVLGTPLAPLGTWRAVTGRGDAVVVVVEDGAVDVAELRETRAVLEAVGVRPLAVLLVPARRRSRRRGKGDAPVAPVGAAPTGTAPARAAVPVAR